MESYTRITSITNDITTSYVNTIWRLNDKAFTRNRKMNYESLVKTMILKKGQTLSLELDEITTSMNIQKISKQAYSKQRMNLNPKIFKHLNEKYIKRIYDEIDVKKYKGYIILAVDGSIIELPNSNELKEYYGLSEGQKGSVGRVRARGLGIYDCLNKIMINSNIDPYKISEKEQLIKLLDDVKKFYNNEKILMVFDRYYCGIAFINLLEEKGIKYLIRMRDKSYKREKAEMKSDDEEVNLKVRTNAIFYAKGEELEKLKGKKYVNTRIIKVKIGKKKTEEQLCTNLTKKELTKEEAKKFIFCEMGYRESI